MPARHQEDVAQPLVAQAPQEEFRTGHGPPLLVSPARKASRPCNRYSVPQNRGGTSRPGVSSCLSPRAAQRHRGSGDIVYDSSRKGDCQDLHARVGVIDE